MRYLALNGYTPFQVLLDEVDSKGRTLKHLSLWVSREEGESAAQRIIDNNPLTLAVFNLPPVKYRLIRHACDAGAPNVIIECLREFRDEHGRLWKSKLRALWTSGNDEGLLRQARNYIGPNRLDKIKL